MERFTRRRFVQDGTALAAACGLALISGCTTRAEQAGGTHSQSRATVPGRKKDPVFRPLQEADRVTLARPAKQVIDKADQLGRDLMKQHGGCSRCTIAAMQQSLGFLPADADLLRAASVLDGGATPSGVQNCGAFTGAGMVIGYACGPEGFTRSDLARRLFREVYSRFENAYGSVLCKDIKPKAVGGCSAVVGLAARWTAQSLLGRFAGYEEDERA